MEKIKLIVTEDQELMRKSLISLLEYFPQMEVVGEAADGRELMELLKRRTVDIVLLDVEMPVMDGKATLSLIRTRFPNIKVIMLSIHNEDALVYELVNMGARAYLPKGCSVDCLVHTIEEVHKNGYYVSEKIGKVLLKNAVREKMVLYHSEDSRLSNREIAVLKALCEGHTNREIAKRLYIAPRTVDYHRTNIYSKTGVKNIVELVRYSIKNGFIEVG